MNLLPSASSVVSLADSQDRAAFATMMKIKEEPMDVESVDSNKEEVRLLFYKFIFIFSSATSCILYCCVFPFQCARSIFGT